MSIQFKTVEIYRNVAALLTLCILVIACFAAAPADAREKKWKVNRIEFKGNASFPRAVLLSRMELKQPVLFSRTVFTEYKLRSDITALEHFYQSQGFLDVSIEKGKVFRDTLKYHVTFSININEGDRYTIKSVKINSGNQLNNESLFEVLKSKTGCPLVTSVMDEDCGKIEDRFRENGYLYVKVFPEITVDTLENTISMLYTVREGPIIYVDTIMIKGNHKLKERVVRRELTFRKKEKLTIGQVQKTEHRLYRTNLFSYVKIEPVLSDTVRVVSHARDTLVPVVVNVENADFFKVEAGAGYGTADGFRGSLSTSYGNLFGIGHKVSLLGNLSQKQQEIEGRYGVPWFITLPLRFDISLYMNNRTDKQNTYDALLKGLQLTAGQQTDFNFAYQFWVKWEDVSQVNIATDQKNTQSIGVDLVWDTRHDIVNPEKGAYNQLRIETAGLTDKRSNEFVKITTDSRLYWKTGKIRYASGLKTGWTTTFGGTDSLPLQERFFGGGSRSVRGFKEGELRRDTLNGEIRNLGGTSSLIANLLEIRFPIVWWFDGALFTDAGNIWIREKGETISFSSLSHHMRWTAGAGLRCNTPIAVIRFDTGFKINKRPDEGRYEFHLDIGNSF